MALNNAYVDILVESFRPPKTGGRHGLVHVRPLKGQQYPTHLLVECSKKLVTDHPPGTIFRIRAKLTDREGGAEFLYSSYRWPFFVLSKRAVTAFLKKARKRR